MPSSRGLRPLLSASSQAVRVQVTRRELSSLLQVSSPNQATEQQRNQALSHLCQPKPRQVLNRQLRPSSVQPQKRNASSESSSINKTQLYDVHTKLGAKMVPFAGFSMPLDYPDQSHPTSHKWTRTEASLFDVSHMVQHKLSGKLAEEFLMTITPSSLDKLEKHHSQLSTLLDSKGGIVDDTVITRLGRDSFYFVTNAGCREQDCTFIQEQRATFLESKGASKDDIVWHILENHSLLALQGPKAAEILQKLVYEDKEDDTVDTSLSTLYFGTSRWLQLHLPPPADYNTPSLLISRTGYTGEDGFEISIPPENGSSVELATAISNALTADQSQCRWAGLAARDSLRLEAGMCLYGHDISTEVTPPMAGLGWVVGKDRRSDNPSPPFNGHEIINDELKDPKKMTERRVGFTIEKGPAAREGAEIVDPDSNEVIGRITSGCPSPTLEGQNIAMGYIKNGYHKKGTKVAVKVRKGTRKAEVAKMPFVESRFYRA